MTWSVECADVLTWCEDYAAKIERGEAEPFHASLGDWPYELSFMGKRWDATGVSFQPETWEAIASVLHPGGFILAFGGSRTYHRLAVAAEDAGLIVHPALVWLNGQGFPKATRIDTQIDKAAGAEQQRGFVPDSRFSGQTIAIGGKGKYQGVTNNRRGMEIPATPLAAAWAGHRYGLQALKPCAEFILCAQKPYEGKPVDCITSTGAGALNIDGSRVATGDKGLTSGGKPTGFNNPCYMSKNSDPRTERTPEHPQGRWPPNVCLSHVPPRQLPDGGWLPGCERLGVKRVRGQPLRKVNRDNGVLKFGGDNPRPHHNTFKRETVEGYADPDGTESVTAYACVLACDPSAGSGCGHQWTAEQRGACPECGGEARWACAVGELGEQSGRLHPPSSNGRYGKGSASGFMDKLGVQHQESSYSDKGTAARFYPQFTWQHEIAERLAGVVPFYYCAKSARRERDVGLDGIEPQITRVVHNQNCRECPECDRHYPNSTKKCECGGKLITAEVSNPPRRNPHPTVKPISLLIWLARLLAPPPEYAPRRLLVPFSGSGSECAAAVLSQNWETVVGIEMEQSYVDIARARLRFWADWAARGYDEPAAILKATKREEEQHKKVQMELTL